MNKFFAKELELRLSPEFLFKSEDNSLFFLNAPVPVEITPLELKKYKQDGRLIFIIPVLGFLKNNQILNYERYIIRIKKYE